MPDPAEQEIGVQLAGLVSKSTLFDHYRHELSVQVGTLADALRTAIP